MVINTNTYVSIKAFNNIAQANFMLVNKTISNNLKLFYIPTQIFQNNCYVYC